MDFNYSEASAEKMDAAVRVNVHSRVHHYQSQSVNRNTQLAQHIQSIQRLEHISCTSSWVFVVEEKDRKMSDDEASERAEFKRQHAAIMRNRIKNESFIC